LHLSDFSYIHNLKRRLFDQFNFFHLTFNDFGLELGLFDLSLNNFVIKIFELLIENSGGMIVRCMCLLFQFLNENVR